MYTWYVDLLGKGFNSQTNMILSFINIRNVPRQMLKTSSFALGFYHLPRDLANVNERKIMFDPYINWSKLAP